MGFPTPAKWVMGVLPVTDPSPQSRGGGEVAWCSSRPSGDVPWPNPICCPCTHHSPTSHNQNRYGTSIVNFYLQRTEFCNIHQSYKESLWKEIFKKLQWPSVSVHMWNSDIGLPQILFVFSWDLGHFTQLWPLSIDIAEHRYTTWLKCVAIKCLLMANRNYLRYGRLLPHKDKHIAESYLFFLNKIRPNFTKLNQLWWPGEPIILAAWGLKILHIECCFIKGPIQS